MTDQELEALASQQEGQFVRRRRTMEDFRYDEQQEKFWDTTTGNLLGGQSVDGAIHPEDWPTRPDGRSGEMKPYAPSRAINSIDTGLTVEGSTWWPGREKFLRGVVVSERGVMPLAGAVCYNLYIPPTIQAAEGDPQPWIDHVQRLYPARQESEHFFDFCAHMIQRPDQKVNHGVVLAGSQGIGKDTALLPVRRGVGEWNAAEVGPEAITSQYNGHIKSVLLVINEVRPHDEDWKASNFYNMLKPILASPPEMLPMTKKYMNTIYIRNLCHVILTTNDPLTMFIPPEDRRLFVMSSSTDKPGSEYFERLYNWLENGGTEAVVWWLKNRDLSKFDPAVPPPMTSGKQKIIDSAQHVRRGIIDDIMEQFLEQEGEPEVFFAADLREFIRGKANYFDDEQKALNALKARNLHFKIAEWGYHILRPQHAKEYSRGKFRSRSAFVHKRVPDSDADAAIDAELDRRGESSDI